MNKKILKKTISIISLLAVFSPFTALALPEVLIEQEKVGEKEVLITVRVTEQTNRSITFSSDPSEGVIFSPSSCRTAGPVGGPSGCSSYFRSTNFGDFTVIASMDYGSDFGNTIESDPITIKITEENVAPVCDPNHTPPQVYNPDTNKCEDCVPPKIIVNGECETKLEEGACISMNMELNTNTNKCECVSPNTLVKGLCTTPAKIPSTEEDCEALGKILDEESGLCVENPNIKYKPLAPLPGFEEEFDSSQECAFGAYLNIVFRLVIGISAVLAMVMIVYGGIEYMSGSVISQKENGKETITNAIFGLAIALGSWLLLNTLNPQLLSVCLDLPKVEIKISPEQEFMILNRSGSGKCAVVTDTNSACHPSKMTPFVGTTGATEPFKQLSSQASAICQLESNGASDAPRLNGTGKNGDRKTTIDYCKNDGTVFSFGLFQINILANGKNISFDGGKTKCGDLFEIPPDGDYIDKNSSAPGGYTYNCKLKAGQESRYTSCKNYLLNPVNNIKEAYKMYQARTPRWKDWSTYKSCSSKF